MKKTLALLALLIISVGAMAQLNVTAQIDNTTEKLGQEIWYNATDSTYYLTLATTNQFDKPMLLKLGKGKQSATQTLKDLKSLISTLSKGDDVIIDNGYGRQYTITKYDNKNLIITAEGYAGHRFIWAMKLDRWTDIIKEHGKEW